MVERIFKALSSPWRIEILKRIAKEPLCQCEFEKSMAINITTISRHVRELVLADLIEVEQKGVMKILHIKDKRILEIIELAEKITNKEKEHV
ncbi:MAG: ArsR/SmtB family transcription factor [Atribacter sp.]|jgi:ArsR family transcriptional regulator|uniref:ArsR/SmtB family transcription factor n=1 Tax=Atribacter sp. TaxID=2847780 RepID=UPI003D9522C7|nr:helix-turn-helix domain-containing protein [Atribacterota bacterium]